MSFLLYAWISTFAYGFLAVIGKLTSKHSISNPWLFNFVWTFFALLLAIPLAFIYKVGLPKEWFFLSLAALCNAIWLILYAFSVYRLDVSVLSPLYNFRIIFAVILGGIFLHEQLLPFQIVLFLIIFVAGMFVSLDEKFQIMSFFSSSVLTLIAGMFFLALSNVLTNITLKYNGRWETTLGLMFLTVTFLLTTIPLFLKDVRKVSAKQISPLFLMALMYLIGTITAFEAFKVNVSLSSIIISLPTSLLLVFLFAVFKPQLLEKHTVKVYAVRFIACIIMIAAALKLAG